MKVPTYESQVGVQPVQGPQIPPALGGLVAETVERSAAQIGDIWGKIDTQLTQAEDSAQAAKATSFAAMKLGEIRNQTLQSPEFQANPELARTQWGKQVEELGNHVAGSLTRPGARQYFQEAYGKAVVSHANAITDDVYKQRLNLVTGEKLSALRGFQDAAATAPTPQIYEQAMQQGFATIASMRASGIIKPLEEEEYRRKFLDGTQRIRISNIALQDPEAAWVAVQGAESKGLMTPGEALALKTHLQPLVESRRMGSDINNWINGTGSPSPSKIAPKEFKEALLYQESQNRDYNADGTPVTSPKGARYASQVMPETARKPGFGITPAQSDTPEEYNRVGGEYLNALLGKYGGNQVLAAAAYNAGFDRVDKLIDRVGDPRTGKVPISTFIAGLPKETQGYVAGIDKKMGGKLLNPQSEAAETTDTTTPGQSTNVVAPQGPMSAQYIKANYADLLKQARERGQMIFGNDTRRVDQYEQRAIQELNRITHADAVDEEVKYDVLRKSLIGPNPIRSMNEVTSNPELSKVYQELSVRAPEKVRAFEAAVTSNAQHRNNVDPAASIRTYNRIRNMMLSDDDATRKAAAEMDLTAEYSNLTDADYRRLDSMQVSLKEGKRNYQLESTNKMIKAVVDDYYPKPPTGSESKRKEWELEKERAHSILENLIAEEQKADRTKSMTLNRVSEIARGALGPGFVAGSGFMGIGKEKGPAFKYQDKPAFSYDESTIPPRFKKAAEYFTKNKQKSQPDAVVKFDHMKRVWFIVAPDGQRMELPPESK